MALERLGDEVTRSIMQRLNTTFVTPFDREDIHALAEELDDVVDDMLAVAALINLFQVKEILPELKEQADVLVQLADQVAHLLRRLDSMKGVEPYLEAIDRLETEGDHIYRRALARLFSEEMPALEVPEVEGRGRGHGSGDQHAGGHLQHRREHRLQARLIAFATRGCAASVPAHRKAGPACAYGGVRSVLAGIRHPWSRPSSSSFWWRWRSTTPTGPRRSQLHRHRRLDPDAVPRHAVAWAAFFNFAAFMVFGTEVAATIAKDVVDPSANILSVGIVFAGLIGAIGWNLCTFYLGLPSSSSHALVVGMAGAAVARSGFEGFRRGQLLSAAAFSLGHGRNDAQKTMGIILAVLIASGHLGPDADVPLWVVLAAHLAIGRGTLSGG